jgi:hypothetical protein
MAVPVDPRGQDQGGGGENQKAPENPGAGPVEKFQPGDVHGKGKCFLLSFLLFEADAPGFP